MFISEQSLLWERICNNVWGGAGCFLTISVCGEGSLECAEALARSRCEELIQGLHISVHDLAQHLAAKRALSSKKTLLTIEGCQHLKTCQNPG